MDWSLSRGWALRVPTLGVYRSEHGYLVQGGSLPVSLANLQYLSLRMNAAALGCLCLLKIPFLFPTTRVIPAEKTRTSDLFRQDSVYMTAHC